MSFWVGNAQKVMEKGGKVDISKRLRCGGFKVPHSLQKMMIPKHKGHTWPSPSPASLFSSVCATNWMLKFFGEDQALPPEVGVNAAWVSVLAKPGWVLAQKSCCRLLQVVASSEYAFLAWDAQATQIPGEDGVAYTVVPERRALQFHNIVELNDFITVPVEPCLLTPVRGPLAWKKVGEAMPLQNRLCLEGCQVTNARLKMLIQKLNGVLPQPSNRRSLQERLVETCLPPCMQQQALDKLETIEKTKEEDLDSVLSEVVSELNKEDGMQQDLRDLQQRKKLKKARRKLQAKGQEDVQSFAKKIAKQKAKQKAKPKAKQKKAPEKKQKAAMSFLKCFAQKRKAVAGQGVLEACGTEMPGAGSSASQHGIQSPPSPCPPSSSKEAPSDSGQTQKPPSEEKPVGEIGEPDPKKYKKTYKSPEELLSLVVPPMCTIALAFTSWRFVSSWRVPVAEHAKLHPPYSQKTMSLTFTKLRSWQEALSDVHAHSWRKWEFWKEKYPLRQGQEAQTPGLIAPEVLEGLQPIIEKLPPPVQYAQLKIK